MEKRRHCHEESINISPPSLPLNFVGTAHLVGICGSGMKALAEVLADRGWRVSGCDRDPDPAVRHAMEDREIPVAAGHAGCHLDDRPDLLIYSPAVGPDNPERRRAAELGVEVCSYVDMLQCVMESRQGIAVAGTHGKSTTTALLGHLLERAGLAPTVLCGAELRGRQRNGWAGDGTHVVVEACEYRQHFTRLHPQIACILGIEPDHFDCYPTLADAEQAYRTFARNVPLDGKIIFRADCDATRHVLQVIDVQKVSFSLDDPAADWHAAEIRTCPPGQTFTIRSGGESQEVYFPLPGRHSVLNALAAAVCARSVGVSLAAIAAGLESFSGLKRRFELIRSWRGVPVIDDYAHHPTEIRATLQAARELYPSRRLICVFQPHQVSRTAALLRDLAEALRLADRVYLLPVFAAREAEGPQQGQLSQQIVEILGEPATMIPSLDQVWPTLQTDAGADAVILTLGAGNLTRVHHECV